MWRRDVKQPQLLNFLCPDWTSMQRRSESSSRSETCSVWIERLNLDLSLTNTSLSPLPFKIKINKCFLLLMKVFVDEGCNAQLVHCYWQTMISLQTHSKSIRLLWVFILVHLLPGRGGIYDFQRNQILRSFGFILFRADMASISIICLQLGYKWYFLLF